MPRDRFSNYYASGDGGKGKVEGNSNSFFASKAKIDALGETKEGWKEDVVTELVRFCKAERQRGNCNRANMISYLAQLLSASGATTEDSVDILTRALAIVALS